ncbi:MAG: DUF6782 family putative metallopeptidase [Alphaproteobacteria bacterium]
MSESFEQIPGMNKGRAHTCRVAYTLNNAQPVLCSIISDQPVFYMDNEEVSDDMNAEDALHELDNLRMLESEIRNLQREIQSLQRIAADNAKAPDMRLAEILADKNTMTGVEINKDEHTDISALFAALENSRMAKFYLEFAAQHSTQIVFCTQIPGASYERKAGKILVNPSLVFPEQVILLGRELRRHWQHRNGALIHPLMFHPDHAILVNRLQAADLAASMVRIAWELQLSGDKTAWHYIENSAMADLGRSFAREAYLDFRTLNNGMAAAAVVETWFLSERCRTQDKILIRQMLADYKGYVFNVQLSSQVVTPALISALGCMPYGNNYLAKHAQTILGDPVFTEIRDRSNANFLWFIKFEQSYKETEATLQQKFESSARGKGQGLQTHLNNSTNSGFQPETSPALSHAPRTAAAKTAEIICFASKLRENDQQYKSVDNSGKTGPGGKERRLRRVRLKRRASAQIVAFSRKSAD